MKREKTSKQTSGFSRFKHPMPRFLSEKCTQEKYQHWLKWKANAHYKRDRKRKYPGATQARWKEAIHEAVKRCKGKDDYTGRLLRWDLLRKYDNKKAKGAGIRYKKKFAGLPSVDHYNPLRRQPDFRICAWFVNDAKSDLTYGEFLNLCRAVLKHQSRRI
ncbi:MAG: hypothetical protein HY360_20095 [Verrucomicrobia bacterium]|nr:hypothetical protein [Verrucomicrobiota bacterium]